MRPLPTRDLWIHTCSFVPDAAQHTLINRFLAAPSASSKKPDVVSLYSLPVPVYYSFSLINDDYNNDPVTATKTPTFACFFSFS